MHPLAHPTPSTFAPSHPMPGTHRSQEQGRPRPGPSRPASPHAEDVCLCGCQASRRQPTRQPRCGRHRSPAGGHFGWRGRCRVLPLRRLPCSESALPRDHLPVARCRDKGPSQVSQRLNGPPSRRLASHPDSLPANPTACCGRVVCTL